MQKAIDNLVSTKINVSEKDISKIFSQLCMNQLIRKV